MSTQATPSSEPAAFAFPPIYSFPAFYTLQPNPTTRSSQLSSWSALIQSYCRHHRLFSLTLADALTTPLFTNARLGRKLSLRDAQAILSWMASPEGGNRAEWVLPANSKAAKTSSEEAGAGAARCWVYWRRPEEWAAALEEWVDRTGQKGMVLTLYELTEGDAVRSEEWAGMEGELLAKCLAVSVKRGKAQVFGAEGSEGVKFF